MVRYNTTRPLTTSTMDKLAPFQEVAGKTFDFVIIGKYNPLVHVFIDLKTKLGKQVAG